MKKILSCSFLLFIACNIKAQNVGINNTNPTPAFVSHECKPPWLESNEPWQIFPNLLWCNNKSCF